MQLNDELVCQWLASNPEFFERNPELLESLVLIQPDTGQAVPLLQRQNQLLRQNLAQNHDFLEELIGNAKRNERLFQQVQALSLSLAGQQSLPGLAEALRLQLMSYFEVDDACVLWFGDLPSSPGLKDGREATQLPDWHGHQALCGPASQHTIGHLNRLAFGDASEMQSLAVAPVSTAQQALGLLVLGNKDPLHFRNSMDSLFLTYVARLVAVLAGRC